MHQNEPTADTGGAATAATEPPPEKVLPLSPPARLLLAALSVAAGAIHLAMVPSHLDEWAAEGLAFAAVGILQIGLAALFVWRPTALAVRVSCLANALFIAAWAVTRTSGAPFGPEADVAEAATFVDVSTVLLEAALVIVGYELLVRPVRGALLPRNAQVLFSVVPIGILAIAVAAIFSPSASNHAHHGDEAAHAHGAAAADGHGHDADVAAEEDDKGLSLLMNGQGEGGGHTHEVKEVKLDRTTQRQLDEQLGWTEPLIEKYPTVADAVADGYYRQGPFSPGLGAHYSRMDRFSANADGKVDPEDVAGATLIYDGIEDDSPLAGFMFLSYGKDKAPEGFAGPNDQWHFHTNVCIVMRPDGGIDAPLGADTTATKDLCDKYGGFLVDNTGYMAHVWTVPGYESPQGVFSNVNAAIDCDDGTYYVVTPEEIGTRTNACKDAV